MDDAYGGDHETTIRPYYPAAYRYYTARCTCGWQQNTHQTPQAAEAAVNTHISTTAHHSVDGA